MKIPIILLATAFLLAGPAAARAQGCATSVDAAEILENVGGIFFDPDQEAARNGQIDLLGPDEPRYVVRDSAVCAAAVDAAVARMREENNAWREGREGAIEALVFRFGPYYAVTLTATDDEPDPADPNVLSVTVSHAPVILRARDLAHLHTVYM